MKKISIALLIISIFLVGLTAVLAAPQNIAKVRAAAVTSEGKGVITDVEVELIEGRGRILLNTEPFGGVQLQNSERVAAIVAQNFTQKNLSDKDMIITFKADAYVVDGPSAGTAITVAMISAIEGKPLRNDTSLTGTIQPDGSVGPVSSIFDKAKAVSENGFKIFIIPKGQELQAFNVERVETPAPGFNIVRTVVQYRNLTRYAAENWNLTIIQASTIADVHDIMISGKNTTRQPKIELTEKLQFKNAVITSNVGQFIAVAENKIKSANISLSEAKAELLNANLNAAALEDLLDSIRVADDELSKARSAFELNYLYGAANHAFRSGVFSKSAIDIIKFNSLSAVQQESFFNGRKSEAALALRKAQQRLSDISNYENDLGAYEWAISAQNRLTQAEEQMNQLESSENPFYSLALIEKWSEISTELYNLSKTTAVGEKFDKSLFANESAGAIIKTATELSKFTSLPEGVVWLLQVSDREYGKGWFVAAYTDASIANSRIEIQRSLSVRNFEDLIEYAETEINKIGEKNSAFAKLYKDQANLVLYYAKKAQDAELVNDALFFAGQAKVFSELAEKVGAAPKKEVVPQKQLPPVYLIALVAVVAIALLYFAFFREEKIKPVKRRL